MCKKMEVFPKQWMFLVGSLPTTSAISRKREVLETRNFSCVFDSNPPPAFANSNSETTLTLTFKMKKGTLQWNK